MAERLSEERLRAVELAIRDIVAKLTAAEGKRPTDTRLGKMFGVSQQTISSFWKTPTAGQKLGDGVATHLETTIDWLVTKYVRGKGAVRAGDTPGWGRAVQEAKRNAGQLGGSLNFELAADVILPRGPDEATPEFAMDLAILLAKHTRESGVFERQAK